MKMADEIETTSNCREFDGELRVRSGSRIGSPRLNAARREPVGSPLVRFAPSALPRAGNLQTPRVLRTRSMRRSSSARAGHVRGKAKSLWASALALGRWFTDSIPTCLIPRFPTRGLGLQKSDARNQQSRPLRENKSTSSRKLRLPPGTPRPQPPRSGSRIDGRPRARAVRAFEQSL